MVTTDQRVKLIDYGFAKKGKIGDSELIAGTLVYMAPELVNGNPCSNKIDIWSLGIIMYILMTGKMPFSGSSKKQISEQIQVLD